ncbi:MAG: FHA domain-containing protein [Myxococcales bacterium]|nr:FHA domain-containing protein [Myxococcales bacterium]
MHRFAFDNRPSRFLNSLIAFSFAMLLPLTSFAAVWWANLDLVDGTNYGDTKKIRFFVDVLNDSNDVVANLKPEYLTVLYSDAKKEDVKLDGEFEISTFADKDFGVAVMLVFAGHSNYAGEEGAKFLSPCKAQREGFKKLADTLKGQDQLALYTYTNTQFSKKLASFTRDYGSVKQELDKSAKCDKPVADPKKKARIQLFRTIKSAIDEFKEEGLPRRKILIVMSDGQDIRAENQKAVRKRLDEIREAAETNGVRVYAVGFSMEGGKYLRFLRDMARVTNGTYRELKRLNDIETVFFQIGQQIKKQYVIDFTPKKFKGDNKDLQFQLVLKIPKGPAALKTNKLAAGTVKPIPFPWMKWVIWIGGGLLAFIFLIIIIVLIAKRPKKEKPVAAPMEEHEEEEIIDDTPRGPVKGKLEVVAGPHAGRTFWITDDITTIGSMDGNNIVLNDSSVSKRHAGIKIEDKRYELADFGSTNSTFINGRKINKQFLRDGDKIRFGDTEMVFHLQ